MNRFTVAGALTWISRKDDALPVALLCDGDAFSENDFEAHLAESERQTAAAMRIAEERRSFIFRRAFQRCFVATVIGWTDTVGNLPLVQARDQRPACPAAPNLCLSFTSSGPVAMAAAGRGGVRIGLDLEKLRPIEDIVGLARRFFTAVEVAYLMDIAAPDRSAAFQRIWTIKEACLKAVGIGVVHGLDAFEVSAAEDVWSVNPPSEFARGLGWTILTPAAPQGYIAALAICSESGN